MEQPGNKPRQRKGGETQLPVLLCLFSGSRLGEMETDQQNDVELCWWGREICLETNDAILKVYAVCPCIGTRHLRQKLVSCFRAGAGMWELRQLLGYADLSVRPLSVPLWSAITLFKLRMFVVQHMYYQIVLLCFTDLRVRYLGHLDK